MLNAIRTERPATNVMVGLALSICAAWIIPGLVGHDPWKPDEAYTFGLVYHVLQGGSWVVPMLAGEPFVQQPPLFVLTAALFAKAFSPLLPVHDGARLATAAYIALAFGFTAAAGRELHGRNRGWVTVLLLLGSVGLAVRAHQLIPDSALLAGFAIGCYGLALMPRRAITGGLWLGSGAGLGFMAKGLFAPGALALSTLILILTCRSWRTRAILPGVAAALGAVLPWLLVWPLALYLQSSDLFWQWWMHAWACLLRTEQPDVRNDHLHYLRILPWYAWPSLPLALWVLWGTRISRFARAAIQLPVVVFVLALALLSACGPMRELHAMPLLVPLALLATPAVDNMRRGASNSMYWFGVMGFSFFAVVAWVYWSGLELGIPGRLSRHLHKLQPAYDSHVRWLPLLAGVAFCCAWIALLAKLGRMAERPVIVWAAGMTLIWGLLNTLFLAYADTSKSYRSMVTDLVRALPPGYDCISSRGLGESQRAVLHYFGGIITYREEVPERRRTCDLMLAQGERSNPPEIPPGWHQVWEGTRPGENDEYFWLYGYGPPRPLP
ncbi:MAG: glycosyltransferase family 39 protein [Burkholderiales bacterium]|nr:glycosyltransferase family 39 protein [Burkholderiales bacterium]